MLEGQLRPYLQKNFFNLIANRLCSFEFITPNLITLLALVTGICVCPSLYLNQKALAILFLFLSGFFDVLDGTVARMKNQSSNTGTVLDIITDRVVEFTIIFALFIIDPINRALPVVLILGSILLCITSFLVVGIFTENNSEKSFFYSQGLIERAEAFIFFALMIIFPNMFNGLAYTFASLVLLTSAIRLKEFIECEKKSI